MTLLRAAFEEERDLFTPTAYRRREPVAGRR
jgi:hypothetical protein